MRQYALEKLGESGEADDVRDRHRSHYLSVAEVLDESARPGYLEHIQRVDGDIDNLRAAFGWTLETGEAEMSLRLASALFPIWQDFGRNGEGMAWMKAAIAQHTSGQPVDSAVLVRALSDDVMFDRWTLSAESVDEANTALTLAREIDDPALVIRALIAQGTVTAFDGDVSRAVLHRGCETRRGPRRTMASESDLPGTGSLGDGRRLSGRRAGSRYESTRASHIDRKQHHRAAQSLGFGMGEGLARRHSRRTGEYRRSRRHSRCSARHDAAVVFDTHAGLRTSTSGRQRWRPRVRAGGSGHRGRIDGLFHRSRSRDVGDRLPGVR